MPQFTTSLPHRAGEPPPPQKLFRVSPIHANIGTYVILTATQLAPPGVASHGDNAVSDIYDQDSTTYESATWSYASTPKALTANG
jgi:hypothetical protein